MSEPKMSDVFKELYEAALTEEAQQEAAAKFQWRKTKIKLPRYHALALAGGNKRKGESDEARLERFKREAIKANMFYYQNAYQVSADGGKTWATMPNPKDIPVVA